MIPARTLCATALAFLALAAAPVLRAQVWQPTGNLLVPLSGESLTLLADGRVLVAGGGDNDCYSPGELCPEPLPPPSPAQAEIYNAQTGQFAPAGSLVYPRGGQAAVLLEDGRVLIVGGGGPGFAFGAGPPPEIYDPESNTSSALQSVNGSPLPTPEDPLAILLKNGKVLVTGGTPSGVMDGSPYPAWLFDPKTNSFVATGATPSDASSDYSSCLALLPDGDVLLVGGEMNDGTVSADAPPEIYHVATGSWQTIPVDPNTGPVVDGPACVALPNGTVLVAGGETSNFVPGYYAWIFNPASQIFTPTAGSPLDGVGGPGFPLPDGKVLVAGNELYDSVSGQFQQAGGFGFNLGTTMVQLADGGILAAGGVNDGGEAIANAQVFHDTPNPFSLSAPATVSLPTGFGSAPVTVHVQNGFTGPITLICGEIEKMSSCLAPPAPVANGQTVPVQFNMMPGAELGRITAISGNYSYWTNVIFIGPALVVAASPASQTVASGGAVTFKISLASFDSFPVQLSCSNLPAHAACTFTPPTVVIDAEGVYHAYLTITTQAPASKGASGAGFPAALPPARSSPSGWAQIYFLAGGAAIAGMLWLGAGLCGTKARPPLRALALALALALSLACGGNPAMAPARTPAPPPPPTTPPGTYTITVTGSDNLGTPLQNYDTSTQVQLTVQ
ncbi:MAG: Kelch repeat-containing protein [Terriglobales bacterium]